MHPAALAFALVLLAGGPVLASEAPDPLASPACAAARSQLEALLARPATRGDAQLEQARRRAARACLGPGAGTPRRAGAPEPPGVVPPTMPLAVPAAPAPTPPRPPPAPPAASPRPTLITTCDPSGCWDSDGRRLNRQGPWLVGPGGVCSNEGGLVRCP